MLAQTDFVAFGKGVQFLVSGSHAYAETKQIFQLSSICGELASRFYIDIQRWKQAKDAYPTTLGKLCMRRSLELVQDSHTAS